MIFVLINIILFMMYESISFGVTRRSDFDYVRKLAEKDKLELSDDEQEVLDLVNKYRKENGLDEVLFLSCKMLLN